MSAGFLGIDHVPFNYRLREARQRMGWSRRRLAAEVGLTPTTLGRYEALKGWPSRAARERLANVLQDAADYLFPPEVAVALQGRTARTTTSVLPMETLSLDGPQMRMLAAPDTFAMTEQHEMAEAVRAQLDAIPSRYSRVLVARFGLDGDEPMTLEQVGQQFGISAPRVRQIEQKALSRLRHPDRSRHLRVYT